MPAAAVGLGQIVRCQTELGGTEALSTRRLLALVVGDRDRSHLVAREGLRPRDQIVHGPRVALHQCSCQSRMWLRTWSGTEPSG